MKNALPATTLRLDIFSPGTTMGAGAHVGPQREKVFEC
ncbi:UNVERIFIED_ORG: hypothetical protein GGE64_002348 [Rhizobium etli]